MEDLPKIKISKSYNYVEAYLTFRCEMGCSYCINKQDGLVHYEEMPAKDWIIGLSRLVTDDIPITLGGGERPHVGGVVLKVPGEDVQTLSFSTHRDLEVLVPIAQAASLKYGCTVVVAGGIHIDGATKEEIGILIGNVRELMKSL